MRILHIFPAFDDSINVDYIRFVRDYFEVANHSFLVIGEPQSTSNSSVPKYIPGIKYFHNYSRNLLEINRYFAKFDKIIFHSLDIPTEIMALFIFRPSIMKKIVWIEWGYDLYNWKIKESNLKNKLRNAIHYFFRKNIKYFVGIFPPDIEVFKKEFNSSAQIYYATYVVGLYDAIYKKELNLMTLSEKVRNNDCINIQIGHCCDASLNHIKVLEDLLKFKDENIRIFMPLSYGNMEIGDEIEKMALSLYGDKVVCIRQMMDREKYMDFLATIDIAIFNTHRQIGLGNLAPLRYMEKKIYMPAGSVMYDYFISQGINICNYNEIEAMDFNTFTRPVDMKKAKETVQANVTNATKKIEMWTRIFDAPVN